MQLKCVAIDDEPLALEIIKKYVDGYPSLKLVNTFEDAVSGAEYLKSNKVDVLFVDINMPDITGVDLVRSLQGKPMVVFTTAYKKFAYDGFELEALDYLLKPISSTRFGSAVTKLIDHYAIKHQADSEQDEPIYVHSEYRLIKIEVNDIEYVESMQDYIKIHLLSAEKPVLTLMPLKNIIEKLPANRFIRIHRGFVVAKAQIRSIYNRKVKLRTAELPVGTSYADFIKDWGK
ncbi:LytTR family DNA-binding domain-containing protein [Mucilaginibacter sp. CAU 1740]|uniref:LytR/AlgR family response regulator transcription factor n=1 Tax=Mucilaginibacter sp. CAU 1740 TaxID=3140365 RepID=UPI00325AA108